MNPKLLHAHPVAAPEVAEPPCVDVYAWRALETRSGSVHLVMLREGGVVRNTSAVAAVDPGLRAVTTSSNRRYQMCLPPEDEELAKAILLANAVRIGLGGAHDVSERLWAQLTAQPPGDGVR